MNRKIKTVADAHRWVAENDHQVHPDDTMIAARILSDEAIRLTVLVLRIDKLIHRDMPQPIKDAT